MPLPRLNDVTPNWRRYACLLYAVIVILFVIYAEVNFVTIFRTGTDVVFTSKVGFGTLPDLCLKSWPPNHSKMEFAFYELHLAGGLELRNSRSSVGVSEDSDGVCFNTSALRLPPFDRIRAIYSSKTPQPRLSIAVLYNSSIQAAKVAGLYLTARDVKSNRWRDVGSFESAEQSLGQGVFYTYLLKVHKERIAWRMTENPFTLRGLFAGFSKHEVHYEFTRNGVNRNVHVNCTYMSGPSHFWVGPDVKTDKFQFSPLANGEIADGPCNHDLKMVHVMFRFTEDTVAQKQYIGITLQILAFGGRLGGLFTLCSALFYCLFRRKNKNHWVTQKYDELTFCLDSSDEHHIKDYDEARILSAGYRELQGS